MRVGSGDYTFEWQGDWGQVPASAASRGGWAHPGMATTARDEIVTVQFHDPTILIFDTSGRLVRSFDTGLTEAHGITVTHEDGTDYLWIADSGSKRQPALDYGYTPGNPAGQVVKMTLDGTVLLTLERPDLPAYADGRYSPTAVAVNEQRRGGNGDVWVADGYGQNYVHRFRRFDRSGNYLGSIDGREGTAGAFTCPHCIWFDYRKAEPELYVADRANKRIQVYDPEGHFKRVIGQDFLVSPSAFAALGDVLVVAELHARVTLLDREDRLITHLGRNDAVTTVDGWPNVKNAAGVPTRTDKLEPGKFNSPHGVTTDAAGAIYVAEWLIGGRMTKLVRQD